jgi:hypothetical protein|tara:strand:+ start:385 stop:681 length:297 start_codon:yes stop_codon:yes gene_type:complete
MKQWREIGEAAWMNCQTESWFEHCEKSAEHETRYCLHRSIQNKRSGVITTPAERKRAERARDKAKGLIRRDVKAHAEDWAEIRALELKLKNNRGENID